MDCVHIVDVWLCGDLTTNGHVVNFFYSCEFLCRNCWTTSCSPTDSFLTLTVGIFGPRFVAKIVMTDMIGVMVTVSPVPTVIYDTEECGYSEGLDRLDQLCREFRRDMKTRNRTIE